MYYKDSPHHWIPPPLHISLSTYILHLIHFLVSTTLPSTTILLLLCNYFYLLIIYLTIHIFPIDTYTFIFISTLQQFSLNTSTLHRDFTFFFISKIGEAIYLRKQLLLVKKKKKKERKKRESVACRRSRLRSFAHFSFSCQLKMLL